MKKIILLGTLFISFAIVHAQDWKTSLVQTVSQKFSLTREVSRKLVDVKETYSKQLQNYQMPHVESQIGKEAKNKAIADLKEKEIAALKTVVDDEVKLKEISTYLEGKIQLVAQPRKR